MPALIFSLEVHPGAPLPLDRLDDFDPAPALAHLEQWLPGLVGPLEPAWNTQVACTTRAALGDWEGALTLSRQLEPEAGPLLGRLVWFQEVAHERLGRGEGARRKVLRESLPPRSPEAGPAQLDLAPYYTARLDQAWHMIRDGQMHEPSLVDFPTGLHGFGGIRFDTRGILQLGSTPFQGLGIIRDYPDRVTGIEVDQRVSAIHLLNASVGFASPGEQVATLVVDYEDGSDATFPLRFGHETHTYMAGTDAAPETIEVVWREKDPFRPGGDKAILKATWKNPHPNRKVHSLEIRATPSQAALFMLAITTDPHSG